MKNRHELTYGSERSRRLAFATAFFLISSDYRVSGTEQDWLAQQFGEDTFNRWLHEFLDLSLDDLGAEIERLAQSLDRDEKARWRAGFNAWVSMASGAGGPVSEDTRQMGEQLLKQVTSVLADQPEPEEPELDPTARLAAEANPNNWTITRWTAHQRSEVSALDISKDNQKVLTGSTDGHVAVWEAASMHPVFPPAPGDSAVTAAVFVPKSTLAVIGSRRGTLRAIDVATGQEKWRVPHALEGGISALAAHPDGARLFMGTPTGSLMTVSTTDGHVVARCNDNLHWIRCIDITADGKKIAIGGESRTVQIRSAADFLLLGEGEKHTSAVLDVRFSSTGEGLVTGGRDNRICLWTVPDADYAAELKGHHYSVYSVDWSPRADRIVSASGDCSARLWKALDHMMEVIWDNKSARLTRARFTGDGKRIFIGTAAGDVIRITRKV